MKIKQLHELENGTAVELAPVTIPDAVVDPATQKNLTSILEGKEDYDSRHLTYVEEWDHTKTPYKSGVMIQFNQEFYVSLTETELPPVNLVIMEDGVIAKVDEHTYATAGSWEAAGNTDAWRKVPHDELRLVSREGTLNGAAADIRDLSGDEVYSFVPNLEIDMVKGVLKGKKVDLAVTKKNVTDALGYTPGYLSTQQQLSADMATVLSTLESLDNLWYGVEFDVTVSSPACKRIGSAALHKTLPIQSNMRGCLLDDYGHVAKYLSSSSWTAETRDGSAGQVMVELPEYYRKFETSGNKRRIKLSSFPLPGYHRVKRKYVSAYEATVERSTSKLCSVVNAGTDYRGGNNTADWDGTYRSLLGRPATAISRTGFLTYARNRKEGSHEWNCYTYDVHKDLYWLFVTEYATLNSQAAYNASKDSNGYMQGGLGDGVTTWDDTWSTFNSYYPFVPCGHTDSLGNASGTVSYTVVDSAGADLKTFSVPRYRGVENPFGHVWKWTEGVNVRISPTTANGGDNLSKVYVCEDPELFSSTGYDGYVHVGNEARSNGYVKTVIFGETGEVMPAAVGGGSTTYHCDYYYTSIPTAETLRGVRFGGAADGGATAGFAYAISSGVPSSAHATFGSRLCFIPA